MYIRFKLYNNLKYSRNIYSFNIVSFIIVNVGKFHIPYTSVLITIVSLYDPIFMLTSLSTHASEMNQYVFYYYYCC